MAARPDRAATELQTGGPYGPPNGQPPRPVASPPTPAAAQLWGLRARSFFLHDARATDLVTAIRLHGGEASGVRSRFFNLPASQRADLLAFLRSL